MMDITTVKRVLETLTDVNLYINSFPADSSECVKFILSDSTNDRGLETLYIRFSAKANHPVNAERLLMGVRNKLDNRTDEVIGDYQIVLTVPETNSPRYEGIMESGQYMYSLEVRLITLELGGA